MIRRFGCVTFSLIVLFSSCVYAENILFLLFPDSGSHLQSAKPTISTLLDAGHNITVLRASPTRFLLERGVHTIDALLNNGSGFERSMFWEVTFRPFMLSTLYANADDETHTFIDKYPEQLRQLFNEHWDLVIVDDLFTTYGYGVALLRRHFLSRRGQPSPFILLSTSGATLNSAAYVQTIGRNWVGSVSMFTWLPGDEKDVYDSRRFTHRAFSFLENTIEHVTMNVITPYLQTTGLRRLALLDFNWRELFEHTDWNFVDYFDRIGSPLSVGSEIINIGARCKAANGVLPNELADFMNDQLSKGTIYVAFGTYADLRYAPTYIVDAIVGALNRFTDYRIILASKGGVDAEFAPRFGKHVRVLNWASQAEILAHPTTRVFVTHSGLKSMKEGICAAVPLVLMPMFAEQAHNAHWAATSNVGPVLYKYAMNVDRVYVAIAEFYESRVQVLNDLTRKARANKLQRLYTDRILDAFDTVRFYIGRSFRRRRRFGNASRVTFARYGQQLNMLTFSYAEVAAFFAVLVIFLTL